MTSSDIPPVGQRFTHVYVRRGEPVEDSPRMRRRLAALVQRIDDLRGGLATAIHQEIGIDVPSGGYGYYWDDFFEGCALCDLLDVTTVAYRLLRELERQRSYSSYNRELWLRETQRIFTEENLQYRVDAGGGVHFRLDEEHSRNQAAAIAALQDTRYQNVLDAFGGVDRAFSEVPPDGKGAIRATFAATEGLFRLILPDAPRLGAKEASELGPLLQRLHGADVTASRASAKMLASFQAWIDAAHFYRHEAGTEDVAQPPLPQAIHITSSGASHLRWLAELDAAIRRS